jgi:hypothetical protein
MGGLSDVQLGLSIFLGISYHLIGYMILASKVVTPAIIIFLYRIWRDLFCRNDNHYYEKLRYEQLSEKRSIRLLQLSRSFPFGPVKCELSIHRIDSRPSYEAISYTWGDPSQSRSVIINGYKLEVNSNAFDILQDRATFLRTRKIWIDSICINQVDKEEKSVQIPLMREIYSRASRVLVWLGSQPDSRIAMGFISNLNRRLRFGGLQGPELKTILEIGSKSPNWRALFSLLNHQYWTRSWIIQEIAVAEPVHISYGGSILTWEYFASTIEMLTTQDVGSLFIPSTPVTAPRQRLRVPIRGTDCIRLISRIRSTVQRESCMELVELLQSTSRSDVTEAKDKIFALLGIADPAAQNSLSRIYNKCKRYTFWQHTTCSLNKNRQGYCIVQALATTELQRVFLHGLFTGTLRPRPEISGDLQRELRTGHLEQACCKSVPIPPFPSSKSEDNASMRLNVVEG